MTLSTIRLDYDNDLGRGYSMTCKVDDALKKNPSGAPDMGCRAGLKINLFISLGVLQYLSNPLIILNDVMLLLMTAFHRDGNTDVCCKYRDQVIDQPAVP